MPLSIKNPEVEALARELARETGDNLTDAVRRALEQALMRARGRRFPVSLEERLRAISDRCAALPDLDTRPADEILGYDETGTFD